MKSRLVFLLAVTTVPAAGHAEASTQAAGALANPTTSYSASSAAKTGQQDESTPVQAPNVTSILTNAIRLDCVFRLILNTHVGGN